MANLEFGTCRHCKNQRLHIYFEDEKIMGVYCSQCKSILVEAESLQELFAAIASAKKQVKEIKEEKDKKKKEEN